MLPAYRLILRDADFVAVVARPMPAEPEFEPRFIEDELEQPFTGTLAWTRDGRGVEVCVAAQKVRYPTHTELDGENGGRVRRVDRVIQARRDLFGVEFRKVQCESCGGWHLYRVSTLRLSGS